MAKNYQWRTVMDIVKGGYVGEQHGVIPEDTGWRTVDIDVGETKTGSVTASYFYDDSDKASTSGTDISRVTINLTDSWIASVDDMNVLTVRVTTTINSISRTAYGNPGTYPRDITIRTQEGGPIVFHKEDDSLNSHTISGRIDVSERTFTIEPGKSAHKASLYYRSHTSGMGEDEKYRDEMEMGTSFKNNLPAPIKYILHYDGNGGTPVPPDQVDINTNGYATFRIPTTTLTRKHFYFHGWSKTKKDWGYESDAEYKPGDSITVYDNGSGTTQTTTLYGVWEYTYRPGMILKNGTWYSHDRDGGRNSSGVYMTQVGWAHIRRNGRWVEMRTRRRVTGLDHPPNIRRSGSWPTQDLIGQDGFPHDVGY